MTSSTDGKRHPFLDDLAENVVLFTDTIDEPVEGRDAVLATVKIGSTIYVSQNPTYFQRIDERRSLFEYDAVLEGGRSAQCVLVLYWNADNQIDKMHLSYAPGAASRSFGTRLADKTSAAR